MLIIELYGARLGGKKLAVFPDCADAMRTWEKTTRTKARTITKAVTLLPVDGDNLEVHRMTLDGSL
jgi:hypothetical protein